METEVEMEAEVVWEKGRQGVVAVMEGVGVGKVI